MTALLVMGVVLSGRAATRLDQAKQDRITQQELSAELRGASTLLTNEVRAYAVTGEQAHLDNYWREVNETKTRDRVVAQLASSAPPTASSSSSNRPRPSPTG